MSLASSPDCQIRAEDKALKLLFPTIEDPITNSFDDYINQALYDLIDGEEEDIFAGDVGDLFDSEAFSSGASSQSPIGASARQREPSPQPWRKGLWCLHQNEPSSQEKPRYQSGVHNQLKVLSQPLNRPGFVNPRSPPPTPSQKGTKKPASPRTAKQSPYVRQTFSREVTLSPSPMYARLPNGRMPQHETWQQDFQNFHLQVQDDTLPLSPPSSGRPVQHENDTRMNAINLAQNGSRVEANNLMMSSYDMNHPLSSLDPLDPDLYVPRPNPMFVPHGPSMLSSPTDQDILSPQYPAQTQVPAVQPWDTDLINTHKAGYVYEPPPMTNLAQTQSWWLSPPSTSNPSTTPSYPQPQEEYYPRIAAPSPQKPVHQLISSSHNLQSGGLMIQYPTEEIPSRKSDQIPLDSTLTTSVGPLSPTSAYPPLPPLKSQTYQQAFSPTSPFTTPRRRNHASPDRSASVSPSNTARSTRQTSPTRSSRRKSMGNSKASGVSKTPRTPKTPKTPNGNGFEMNFVNLTAADSVKLLSDVAPSGSSKTRARREQEAREKRRRLSEAAVRAVRKAGGDVKALEKAIST